MTPTPLAKWRALVLQRCPVCCQGPIYERGMKMHPRCPVCNVLFEREPGYYLGAMYISYALAIVFLVTGLYVGHWFFPDIDLGWMVLICAVCFAPFVPMVTRYSRVIWMFFDHWVWPMRPEEME